MHPALGTATASLALLALAAVSYARRRRAVLAAAAALFFPITAGAVLLCWSPISGAAAVLIILLTLAPSLIALGLFLLDFTLAPFCVEMTYACLVCWVLCPLAVGLNWLALLIG